MVLLLNLKCMSDAAYFSIRITLTKVRQTFFPIAAKDHSGFMVEKR